MIKFINAKCPNCGAKLEIYDKEKKLKCEYCGETIMLDDNTINISGKVSVDGIKTDKELIDNANELIEMGEYIKAKKLFEQFTMNNPNKYQGWLGLFICRTRNFTIRDQNIIFENDIAKYYQHFLKYAPDKVKEYYFDILDRYMNPGKYEMLEIEAAKKKEEQERKRIFEEQKRQKEENKRRMEELRKEKQKKKEEKKKQGKNDNIFIKILKIIGQIIKYLIVFLFYITWRSYLYQPCGWLALLLALSLIGIIQTKIFKKTYIKIIVPIFLYIIFSLTIPDIFNIKYQQKCETRNVTAKDYIIELNCVKSVKMLDENNKYIKIENSSFDLMYRNLQLYNDYIEYGNENLKVYKIDGNYIGICNTNKKVIISKEIIENFKC